MLAARGEVESLGGEHLEVAVAVCQRKSDRPIGDDEGDRYELAEPLPLLTIPATLHDSLMARLDRLAPIKEVAQIGAVIGREFAHDLLAAVAPVDGAKLRDALDRLVASELLFRRGVPPEASYVFKHALVQETAYQSLLRGKRRRLHAGIAAGLTVGVMGDTVAWYAADGGLGTMLIFVGWAAVTAPSLTACSTAPTPFGPNRSDERQPPR